MLPGAGCARRVRCRKASSYLPLRRYEAARYVFAAGKFFRFDGVTPAGSQIVRHTVTLARDGKTYTSDGAAEFYDVNGNLERTTPPGCSTSTATRFK